MVRQKRNSVVTEDAGKDAKLRLEDTLICKNTPIFMRVFVCYWGCADNAILLLQEHLFGYTTWIFQIGLITYGLFSFVFAEEIPRPLLSSDDIGVFLYIPQAVRQTDTLAVVVSLLQKFVPATIVFFAFVINPILRGNVAR